MLPFVYDSFVLHLIIMRKMMCQYNSMIRFTSTLMVIKVFAQMLGRVTSWCMNCKSQPKDWKGIVHMLSNSSVSFSSDNNKNITLTFSVMNTISLLIR
jgi:hypothetical protein